MIPVRLLKVVETSEVSMPNDGVTPFAVVLGSINMDITARVQQFPQIGETLLASSGFFKGGGKGANQALALAKDGADVRLWGCVGQDAWGQLLLDELVQQGVDTSQVGRSESPTGVGMIALDCQGENQIIVLPGANHAVSSQWVKQRWGAMDAAIASLGSIGSAGVLAIAQLELPLEAVRLFLTEAKRRGAVTVLNPSPWQAFDPTLMDVTDIVILNELEARSLQQDHQIDLQTWVTLGELSESSNGMSRAAVVTRGALGADLMMPQRFVSVPGVVVDVVDTVGAGDCFAGVFVARVVRSMTHIPPQAEGCEPPSVNETVETVLEQALRAAVVASALSVTREGAQTCPQSWEIEAKLKELG